MIIIFLLMTCYATTGIVDTCHAATNLALGKSYTLSPSPSYHMPAPPTNKTALTDGKYSGGYYYWEQKTTVGWKNVKMVEILLDLGNKSSVGSISFSTARGDTAGVYYPARIEAYVGPDIDHLLYAGDLAKDPENKPGTYKLKRFALNSIGVTGRYVLLVARPKGTFLFCDEIEVIEGSKDKGDTGGVNLSEARQLFIEREFLLSLSEELKRTMQGNPDFQKRLSDITRRVSASASLSAVKVLEDAFLSLRADILRVKFPEKQFLIETVGPWAPLSPVIAAGETAPKNLSLLLPQGGYDQAALAVTNLSSHPRKMNISLETMKSDVAVLSPYEVPFVKSAAFEYVADPLVPLKNSFTLKSGESKMVFISAYGNKTGTLQGQLKVTSGNTASVMPVKGQVSKVALSKKMTLNSVTWSDFTFNPALERKGVAVKDLLAHHTNVIVVNPRELPPFGSDGPLDFSRFEDYLKMHKGADKILLFINFRDKNRLTASGKLYFMDEHWKIAMRKWYTGAVQAAVRAGFRPDEVYWYPFDEMYDDEIDQFIAIAKWARKEMPGVKMYATLGRKNSEKALPYLDIAQIINDDRVIGEFKGSSAEKWLYDAKGPTKSNSPYSYYRLMAWKAFRDGYKGIGFWAYADAGWGDNPGTAWDDFDGARPDYAVIYEGPNNTIISSRRWEAWRMGIEDYELLTLYANAKGDAAAKSLAKSVMDNPDDTTKADEVRRKILMELDE